MSDHVYHYRHGWIPLDHEAAGKKETKGGGESHADKLNRDYGARERKERVKGMSDADLHATRAEFMKRATALGKDGHVSASHKTVNDEIARRAKAQSKGADVDVTTAYADIVKHERTPAGELMVYGRATGPDLDLDQQICDPQWLAKAMPAWFETGANVREQHSSIAAGVGTELVQEGDGWALRSLVVDPASARKVELGVLKGYSIGIRAPQIVKDASAPGGRITGGQIVEVSLVDRPANPTCQLVMTKALKPGPTGAQQVDAARRLVRVEELHDRTGEPLAAVKALDVDVTKADAGDDVGTAQQAIAIIARLIGSEADALADGRASEACDIDLLLSAVRSLEWFINRENQESPMAVTVGLAASAEDREALAASIVKALVAEEAKGDRPFPPKKGEADDDEEDDDDDEKKPFPPKKDGDKSADPDLTELVKTLSAEVASLHEQVTKALDVPAGGGPVLTRTQQDTTKAAVNEGHLVKAAYFEQQAAAMTDPQAKQGFHELAKQARALATTS